MRYKIISVLLTVFVCMPISFYLQYVILKALNVDNLVWFLFFVNIPLLIFVQILLEIARGGNK